MNYRELAEILGAQGRYGDSELVHVTPREKQMLRNNGGSGTTNPTTGLDEYFDVGAGGESLGSPSEGLGMMEGMQPGSVAEPLGAPQEIGAHPQATGPTVGTTNVDPSVSAPQGSLLGNISSAFKGSGFNPNQPESMIVNALGLAVPGFGLMRGFDAVATGIAQALGLDVAKGPATGMVGSDVTSGALTPVDLGGRGQLETLPDPMLPTTTAPAQSAMSNPVGSLSSTTPDNRGLEPYMRRSAAAARNLRMKNKFLDRSAQRSSASTQIASKLEIIACGIADELISGQQVLRGNLDIQDKVKILDSLRNYYATVNKLDAPEAAGGAFDNFRKQIANGGGGGNSLPEMPPEAPMEAIAVLERQMAELRSSHSATLHEMRMMQKTMTEIPKTQEAITALVLGLAKGIGSKLGHFLLPAAATGGAFWLWNNALTTPDIYKLVGLGLYGGLVLFPLIYWRK